MTNTAQMTGERARLADIVPTRMVAEFCGMPHVHALMDGSLGYAWEIGVPAIESIDNGDEIVADAFDMVIRQLPTDYTLAIYPSKSSNVKRQLTNYLSNTGTDRFSKQLAREYVKRWVDAQDKGFFPGSGDENINFFPTTQQLIMVIKSPTFDWTGGKVMRAISGLFGGGTESAIDERINSIGSDFRRICRSIEQTASGRGLSLRRMDAPDYVSMIEEMLFPERAMDKSSLNIREGEDINEAIGSLGEVEEISGIGLTTSYNGRKTYHRVVSMLWQPDAVEAGMLSNVMKSERDITCVVNIKMLDRNKVVTSLKMQHFLASRMMTSVTAVEMGARQGSLEDAQSRIYDGERLVLARLHIMIRASSEDEAEERAIRIAGALNSHMEAAMESSIGSTTLIKNLPFFRDTVSDVMMARDRRMLSSDISAVLPAGGVWEGTPKNPMVMYSSRWGTPLFINTRECDTNPHFLVVGGSGSGKSFWVHDLITQIWRLPDVRIYLISIKPDYRKISQMLGKYVEINLDNPISINPFGGPPTLENQAFWTAVLINMIAEDGSEYVSKDSQITLSEAALDASRKNWDPHSNKEIKETILEDIIRELNQTDEGRVLARRLMPYHTGPYSKLFNAPRGISTEHRLIFFNIANMAEFPCSGVVMLCLFKFINGVMYDESMRQIPKFLGMDEVWSLMKDPYSAGLVEKAFRAYRSLGGIAFAVTQLLRDFDSPMGRAVLQNTATKFILRQQPDSLQSLREYISLSDKEFDLVASLDVQKRKYSEFFVKMEGMPSTVGRVVPDPLKYAIATTDPTDESKFNTLLSEKDGDHIEAVLEFAKRFPYGQEVRTNV